MYQTSLVNIYREIKKKPTPCELFVRELAEETHRSISTVQKWVTGAQTPDNAAKHAISKYFKTPISVLFPDSNDASDEKQ